jgi:hypothetical protein
MPDRYRKRPVEIEAAQWDGTEKQAVELIAWMGGAGRFVPYDRVNSQDFRPELHVLTLEDGRNGAAQHVASPGDWIIKGVKGEFYPCKPDVFEQTYEWADPYHGGDPFGPPY